MSSVHSIGFIGLGKMGGPMALNLRRAGHEVHVFARNRESLRQAVELGAVAVDSAAELARRSDVVFLCLTDTAAVRHVVFGQDGVASGARPGSILVDHSTISPDETAAMARQLQADAQMSWLDAPISGGTTGATAGSLSIFVGGEQAAFERVLPLLRAVGKNITLMGPIGSGQTTKLINQVIICCSVVMLGEACGLAMRLGVDAEAIPAALAGGRADSVALQAYWSRLAGKDYTPHGTIKSILKDIDLVQAAARKVGAALPLTSQVREYNQILSNSGHAAEDLTAIMRLLG
jgi:3-hydroxyisobutyrate dehydrogenase